MKKEYKILLILFIVALIVRLIFSFSAVVRIWDETVYSNLGYQLSKVPFDYSLSHDLWGDFIPDGSWPKMGFRAPLLPYSLSILYFFKLDFLITFFMPFIGALSVVFLYFLGKKIFNKEVAFYSSALFCFSILHSRFSGMILADVFATFFVILSFIFFWDGFENNKNKSKLFFGLFFGLAILARYNVLWIMPVFLFYFLFSKGLKFLKDKYLWGSILVFFLTLTPWFIYGYSQYGNILGGFIHGAEGASFWGSGQNWYFYFSYWWEIFSVEGILFVFSLGYISYKKEFLKKEVLLVLLWALLFIGIAMFFSHKEDRYLLPALPAIILSSGFFISKLGNYKKFIFTVILLIMLIFLFKGVNYNYGINYTETNRCFLEANYFLKNSGNSMIVTDESPIVYFYSRKITRFYPNPWNLNSLNWLVDKNAGKKTFILFTDYDMPLNIEKFAEIKKDLDKNFEKVFECKNLTFVYKYG